MKCYDSRGTAFLRMGRSDPRESACELWWSGSGIRTRIACARLEIEAEAPDGDHLPWLAVTVDGEPVARFALAAGRNRYAIFESMDGAVAHEVAILRDTQPTDRDAGPLVLLAVYSDGEPSAPAPRDLLVEFMGDSLTVGEGAVGPVSAQEWRMAWISNQFAFPTLAAELLNAEKRIVALGGWGAYKSFDGDPTHTIGGIYERLCAVVPGGDVDYDFSAQRPADAVVINLGTNDASALGKMNPAELPEGIAAFERSAAALMAQVRNHNPDAVIVWAYGLCGGDLEAPIREAVERIRAGGDDRVYYLALEDCGNDHGSRSHPGRASHLRAAAQIAGALKQWMMR